MNQSSQIVISQTLVKQGVDSATADRLSNIIASENNGDRVLSDRAPQETQLFQEVAKTISQNSH